MIVVTGGAGFIGSVFLATLNEHGFKDILLVDEFETNDKWKNTVKRQFNRIVHKMNLSTYYPQTRLWPMQFKLLFTWEPAPQQRSVM